MPAERIAMGLVGVCWPSSVAAMSAVGVTFTGGGVGGMSGCRLGGMSEGRL
jgi:hypothetical protein